MRIEIDEDKLNKIVEALEGCDGCEMDMKTS